MNLHQKGIEYFKNKQKKAMEKYVKCIAILAEQEDLIDFYQECIDELNIEKENEL